jgi:pyrroloquinoline quinone biosynthesis protein D
MLSTESRPRLARKARLRFDRKTERYMLLYPEKGMVLNSTGADVLHLCTGDHTVATIIERLTAKYAQTPSAVEQQVFDFLRAMEDRGLVRMDE